jgi:hypothetical protein
MGHKWTAMKMFVWEYYWCAGGGALCAVAETVEEARAQAIGTPSRYRGTDNRSPVALFFGIDDTDDHLRSLIDGEPSRIVDLPGAAIISFSE